MKFSLDNLAAPQENKHEMVFQVNVKSAIEEIEKRINELEIKRKFLLEQDNKLIINVVSKELPEWQELFSKSPIEKSIGKLIGDYLDRIPGPIRRRKKA